MARSRFSRCSTVLVGYVFFTGCAPCDESSRTTADSAAEPATTSGLTIGSGLGEGSAASVACAATVCPLSDNKFAVLWHPDPRL